MIALRFRFAFFLLLFFASAAVAETGKTSLPTQSAVEAWKQPGFRLQLGVGYGRLKGLGGAPSGRLLGPIVRLGVRLDKRWSLQGSLQYLSASESGGLAGMRFTGTVEPTLHLTRRLSLAIGMGFGGIVEGQTLRDDPPPNQSTLTSSYTYPDASTPLPTCSGNGVVALARLEWMAVLGQKSSTGFAFELGRQWTGCVDETGEVNDDTAEPIVRRQWWSHVAATFAWMFAWR